MRAIVFDMDGLMFNTEDIYTLVGQELLRRRGLVFTEELKKEMMGTPPQQSFERMIDRHRLSETWQVLAAESNRLFLEIVDLHIQPMPGLFDLLGRLEDAGIPKAIATSSAKALLDACLVNFNLHSRFQFFLTAEDVTQGKPNPEIYLTAASRLDVPPAEMVVLEDSQNGCKAAASAGAYAVAVPGEHSRNHDFSTASLVISSLADPRLYAILGIS
jgi:pseudouridine 5'-phosphatase